MGELSAGRQTLEGAKLAPGTEESWLLGPRTLRELNQRPARPRDPIPELPATVPAFYLSEKRKFCQNVSSAGSRGWPVRQWLTLGQSIFGPIWPANFGQSIFELCCVVVGVGVGLLLVCVGVLLCVVGLDPPLAPDPPPPDCQNFVFFTLILFFFSLYLGVFSLNFGGVLEFRDPQMNTFGFSGCRVKPRRLRGRRGFTRQPENCTFDSTGASTPPKFHEKTPKEGQKERKWGMTGKTKERNFGTLRGPTFRGPIFSGFGPHPFGPTMTHTHQIQIGQAKICLGQNWPNQDGQNGIGQSRSVPLGHDCGSCSTTLGKHERLIRCSVGELLAIVFRFKLVTP